MKELCNISTNSTTNATTSQNKNDASSSTASLVSSSSSSPSSVSTTASSAKKTITTRMMMMTPNTSSSSSSSSSSNYILTSSTSNVEQQHQQRQINGDVFYEVPLINSTTGTWINNNNYDDLMEIDESNTATTTTTTITNEDLEEKMDVQTQTTETKSLTLNDVPILIKKPLQLNEFWYILDKNWYEQFLKFLEKNQDLNENPGKIDNSALLEPIKNSSKNNSGQQQQPKYRLKTTVREGEDFIFVPEPVWNLLVETFGISDDPLGGFPYRCPVIPRTDTYFQIELRPLELRLSLYGSKEDMIVQYSRNNTLKQVILDMKKFFRIDEKKPVQLWNNATLLVSYNELQQEEDNLQCSGSMASTSTTNEIENQYGDASTSTSLIPRPPPPPPLPSTSTSNSKAVSNLNQRLLDIVDLEAPGTVLTLEVENNDHTWPSSKTRSGGGIGAITRSKYQSGIPNCQPGVCGLMNLGNTCFMNAAIQCLSNTAPLTKYFLSDKYLEDINPDNPLGMKGEIAKYYADLIKMMWSGYHSSVAPREFKLAVTQFAPQFSGFAHHDCQELMAFLLDGLHEDLNRVKIKPYIEMKNEIERRPDEIVASEAWRNYKLRNDSIIVDTFHAQLKSTLVCPECDLVSVTFDPFCYLTLPLPYRIERSVDIIFVPAISKRPSINKVPCATLTSSSASSSINNNNNNNNDLINPTLPIYTIQIRSILLENVFIPKSGYASDISQAVAKYLNDCFEMVQKEDALNLNLNQQPQQLLSHQQYFNRKFDSKKFLVANIMESRLNKIFQPTDLYNSHLDDIVVYELDDLPTSIPTNLDSTIQTRSSSKFSGHHIAVFLKQINLDNTLNTISRPFFINIKNLSYENAREAIFKELLSIVPQEKHELFLQAMEENILIQDENLNNLNSNFQLNKHKNNGGGGSDGEEQSDADDEDEEMQLNLSNNTLTNDLDDDDVDVDDDNNVDGDDNDLDASASEQQQFGGSGSKKLLNSTTTTTKPSYTITIVTNNGHYYSTLLPGQKLDSTTTMDLYLSININYRLVSKFFPNNINRCGFIRLTTMLPNLQLTNTSSLLTLKECINQFTLLEKLGENDPWYCPRCKKHQMASKKFDIWSLPNNLIIHLKRFSYSRLHRDKLNVLVEFPIENLDMSPYVLHNPQKESFVYDLIAVSNHYGELGAGHYNAYAKNFLTNSWFLFDDYSVSPVSDKTKVMTKAAYVLFYQRKQPPPPQSIPKPLQTIENKLDWADMEK